MALSKEQKQAKFKELGEYIAQHKDIKGPLMPIMQKAQELFGCVSLEVQDFIAEAMNVPLSEVYGVSTFYSQFSLEPKGEFVVGVCTGTACYVKGAQAILEEVIKELGIEVGHSTTDGMFTLQGTRCLGCCGLSPVMMINDDVYGRLTAKEIPAIMAKYKKA